MLVCHTCDIPCCVNPDHLWVGSHSDNIRDCVRKGRQNHADVSGENNPRAQLTIEQVRIIKNTPQKYGADAMLAKRFEVKKGVISHIRCGRAWKGRS